MFEIPFLKQLTDDATCKYALIVDALFGFSFKPPVRPQFEQIMATLQKYSETAALISVDIPSGWNVEQGPPHPSALQPDCLVSLTAPKLCANYLKPSAHHWLGGRFVPPSLLTKYNLTLPWTSDVEQCLKLTR
jgi:NAD(P)H-hydrate epimerase